ncbi:FUSC family protein [Caballeronia sp. AZ10_KS36]|uniref:FUSC family protein n=1 Tax=Caballeronia sp. AZ10_KS36 TaxID=2921757 RepID=UPI0032EAA704
MPNDHSTIHNPSATVATSRGAFAAFDTVAGLVREAFVSLGGELAAIRPTPARAFFATQAMASVALAVALAYAFRLEHIWWAAISGFAVMQSKFSACAQRGVHRVLGTSRARCSARRRDR